MQVDRARGGNDVLATHLDRLLEGDWHAKSGSDEDWIGEDDDVPATDVPATYEVLFQSR